APVADSFATHDNCLGEVPADAAAARLGTDVKPLHLARLRVEFSQRDTADGARTSARQQNAAVRRRVTAGQALQLRGEILEIEVEVERPRVILEKSSGRVDIGWALSFGNAGVFCRKDFRDLAPAAKPRDQRMLLHLIPGPVE